MSNRNSHRPRARCDPTHSVLAQKVGGGSDQPIAGLVTIAVVHRLEVVEIGADDGHRPRVANASRLLGGDVLVPGGAIVEAGQRIDSA